MQLVTVFGSSLSNFETLLILPAVEVTNTGTVYDLCSFRAYRDV